MHAHRVRNAPIVITSGTLRRMIVVGIVSPGRPSAGAALEIARRAAARDARVEIIGSVPGDADGDGMLLELASAGVGHATVTRDSVEPEVADLELALRYLPDIRAIVVVGREPALLPAIAAGASWSGAALIVLDDMTPSDALPVEPIVLAPPARDPDATFAGFVATFAAGIDAGASPRDAWRDTVAALGADRVQAAP